MNESFDWSPKTLTEIEGRDWGEPTFDSFVVTNSHRLRKKPLKDFTPADLRFMLGQQNSPSMIVPMALDVLETSGVLVQAEHHDGDLIHALMKLGRDFWQSHPRLWYRASVLVTELRDVREFIDTELLPAAERFDSARPAEGE